MCTVWFYMNTNYRIYTQDHTLSNLFKHILHPQQSFWYMFLSCVPFRHGLFSAVCYSKPKIYKVQKPRARSKGLHDCHDKLPVMKSSGWWLSSKLIVEEPGLGDPITARGTSCCSIQWGVIWIIYLSLRMTWSLTLSIEAQSHCNGGENQGVSKGWCVTELWISTKHSFPYAVFQNMPWETHWNEEPHCKLAVSISALSDLMPYYILLYSQKLE